MVVEYGVNDIEYMSEFDQPVGTSEEMGRKLQHTAERRSLERCEGVGRRGGSRREEGDRWVEER